MARTYLITGCAGFIGFHFSRKLLDMGHRVVGLDNMNEYYDIRLKQARLDILKGYEGFRFHKMDLKDRAAVEALFGDESYATVVHLAAQAGVRYSLVNPHAYLESNMVGFFNLLDACRRNEIPHFLYASSSSVYGLNEKKPFSVHDNVDHPISFYAASKKSNELTAHTYSHLFGLPTTGLRFFTVYGPWGRPDMAPIKFARSIFLDEPLTVYNRGEMWRDFTYIDDIVQGMVKVVDRPAQPNPDWDGGNPDPGSSPAPYRIYNIGAGNPTKLSVFLELLETHMGRKAKVNYEPVQPGDVLATAADIEDLRRDVGYDPGFPVEEGVKRFVQWFLDYYGDGTRPIPT